MCEMGVESMKLKVGVWVASISVIFLFLPSLAIKIWNYFMEAPWQAKRWIFYLLSAFALFSIIRWRWRRRRNDSMLKKKDDISLLFLAKERLVKGEISLEEFREIKRELD
jgi:Predicted membrane protein